jgi:hypothetical protein
VQWLPQHHVLRYCPCTHGDTFWVTGLNVKTEQQTRPKTLNAQQPIDFKSAPSVEHLCTTGLPETKKLAPNESKRGNLSMTWVSMTQSYIENWGMDIVFQVTSRLSWVNALKTGIFKDDRMPLPVCTFDGNKLTWSGTAILASISLLSSGQQ